ATLFPYSTLFRSRRMVRLLAVDADVADASAVRLDELFALHEHATRTTARVEHAAFERCEHFDEQPHDTGRRVELATVLAFGRRELGEEVFVNAPKDVACAVALVAEADRADQVDELSETRLVERGASVVFGQDTLERRVVALDGDHGVVDELSDRRLRRLALKERPASFLGHPEDVFGAVLVGILGVGA